MKINSKGENLNETIANYRTLDGAKQKKEREKIKARINKDRNNFSKKIKSFQNTQLKATPIIGLNLILGATGSGKSTLFNYLKCLPLVIQQGKDATGKKNGLAIIKIQQDFLQKNSGKIIYSPIGSGFLSQTAQPIFSRDLKTNYINVDCPGEFDNKDFLQSIVNSYLRIDVCALAPKLKLTIVTNFHELMSNRATAFKKTLAEIQKVFGCWDRISVNSVCLVVTHVPADYDDQNSWMKNKLQEILKAESSDLKKFAPILQNIIQKGLFCVMPAPKLKLKPQRNNRNEEQQFCIPEGQPYSPKKQYFSLESLLRMIEKVQYTPIYERLVCAGIKQQGMLVIEDICESLIKQIKQSLLLAGKNKIKCMKRQQLLVCVDKIAYNTSIKQIKQIFKIQKDLENQRLIDLQYFIRLTPLESVQKQLSISKDIQILIKQAINILDQKQQQKKKKEIQRRQKELKRKQNLNYYYGRLYQIQQQINQKIKQRDEISNAIKKAKKAERTELQEQINYCKTSLKQLDEQWNTTMDCIQDLQTDEEKMQKQIQVFKYNEDLLQSYDQLTQFQLKERINRLIQDRKNWMKYKLKYSKDHIYLLSVDRRIGKIKQRLKVTRQSLRQKIRDKYYQLELKQDQIQSEINSIKEYSQQRRKARQKQDRLAYQQRICESKQHLKGFEQEWRDLKDEISEYQDEVDKENRSNELQYDEDLSKEIDDSEMQLQELKQKIKRLTQNERKWQKILKSKKNSRVEEMKLERRIRKLQERLQACESIKQYKAQQNQNSD